MTILLTWPAANMLSLGGEPVIAVAAVGDRRRCVRDPLMPDRRTELDRLTASRIFMASSLPGFPWFSASELAAEELLALSTQISTVGLSAPASKDRRFVALLGSISLKGDVSLSEDDKVVIFGGGIAAEDNGESSPFLAKKPAWNRLLLVGTASVDSGGGGIGEDPGDWVWSCASEAASSETCGSVISVVDSSGELEGNFCGVFSNSARVPSSESSRHLTALLALTGDFLFLGVNDI